MVKMFSRSFLLFFTALVILYSIELHECMHPSSSGASSSRASSSRTINDHLSDEYTLSQNSIEITKSGFSYSGEITYPRPEAIPTWMHRYRKRERTDEFAAFILLENRIHAVAEMLWNQDVARTKPTDPTIARIRLGDGQYFLAKSFEKYDVKRRYHLPEQEFGSPYYPASNYIYIKVPEGDKNVVYRSILQAGNLNSNSIEIKLRNGTCYYGEIRYLGVEKVPEFLHRDKPSGDFLAFILSDDKLHAVAHLQRNLQVATLSRTNKIVARIRIAHSMYYIAQSFEVYDVNSRQHGLPGLQMSSHHYPDIDHVYITVPEDGKSVTYRSRLEFTDFEPLKRFL